MFKIKSYLPKFDNGVDLVKFRQKYPEFNNVPDDILYSKIKSNPNLLSSLNNPVNPTVNTTNTLSSTNPNFKFYNYNASGTEKPMAEQFDLANTASTTSNLTNPTKSSMPAIDTATGISGGIALGNMLDTASKNKDGLYKSETAERLNFALNPSKRFNDLLEGKNVARNLTAMGTMGLSEAFDWGKTDQEKEFDREKKKEKELMTTNAVSAGMNKVNSMQASGWSTKGYKLGGLIKYPDGGDVGIISNISSDKNKTLNRYGLAFHSPLTRESEIITTPYFQNTVSGKDPLNRVGIEAKYAMYPRHNPLSGYIGGTADLKSDKNATVTAGGRVSYNLYDKKDKGNKYNRTGIDAFLAGKIPINKPINNIDANLTTGVELNRKINDNLLGLKAGYDLLNKTPMVGLKYSFTGQGNNSGHSVFAKGGNIPIEYEVEKDEVIQGTDTQLEEQTDLASDMTLAGGETHENGGTLGNGGERVFSDRIPVDYSLFSYLKAKGFKPKEQDTYAAVAEKLGKLKGKFELKSKSPNSVSAETGKVMLDRINLALDDTFNSQEQLKEQEEMKLNSYVKATGGKLPKKAKGGDLEKELLTLGKDNVGQLINLATYAKNVSDVNKLGTNIKRTTALPIYTKAPNYLNKITNEIGASQKTAFKDIENTGVSPQDIFARKAAITSAAIKGKSDAAMQQGLLENQVANQNTSIANAYSTNLATNANLDALDRLEGKNAIIGNKVGARNALLQGIMGNVASKRAYDIEKEKNDIAKIDAGRGTSMRSDYERFINDETGTTYRKDFTPDEHKQMYEYYIKSGQLDKANKIKEKKYFSHGGKMNNSKIMKGYC